MKVYFLTGERCAYLDKKAPRIVTGGQRYDDINMIATRKTVQMLAQDVN